MIDEGEVLTLTLSAEDADDAVETLVFSLVDGPAGASVTAQGQFTWTADDGEATRQVTVRVTDPKGAVSERTFLITILPEVVNAAPVFGPIADRSVIDGVAVAFQLEASDADDDASALTYSLVSGPEGATVSASGLFAWAAAGVGDRIVTVRVADAAGAFDERSFLIRVTPADNAAPVLAPVPDQVIDEGEVLTLTLSAEDADDAAETLVFSLVDGPAGARVSPEGVFTWVGVAGADLRQVTVRVTDPKGAFSDRGFAIEVLAAANAAPVIASVADMVTDEGRAIVVQLTATDPDGDDPALVWALISGPEGAAIDADGRFTWFAADGDDEVEIVARVTDAAGAAGETRFSIRVRDVAPTLSVVGDATVRTASSYTVLLGAFDPGDDTPIEWIIDWGDGTAPTRVAGDAASASYSYADAGDYLVRATLVNDDGSFTAVPFNVSVLADIPLLQVTRADIVDGVLSVRFSQPLADDAAGRQVTLTGERLGLVAVTIRYDADGQGFVLARADGKPLQYDRYSLLIGDDGFVSRDGALLDGDGNGADGGDFRASILFARAASGTAELPDFMRGPGEHVDVPLEDRAGLQVRFTSDGGVKTLIFRVTYDPALLRVDGFLRGLDLPEDAVVAFRTEAAAGGKRVAIVLITSDTPVAAGNRWLLSLDATVPDNAPYGSSEILTVEVESINAAAPSSTQMDQAIQLVGFFGDADADRALTLADLWWASRVAIGLDTSFRAWPGAPPQLVADIRDYRPFANPFLPGPDQPPAEGLPILPSHAAQRPQFDAIAYGTEEAVRKWAGDIHATASAKPKRAGGDDQSAEAPSQQPDAAVADSARPPISGGPASVDTGPAARVDLDAMPVALAPSGTGSAGVRSPLADLLGGDVVGDEGLDASLFTVMLPALVREPRRNDRDRKKRSIKEDGA